MLFGVKIYFFLAVMLSLTVAGWAQSSVLTGPTKAEMESLVSGMDLTMKQKLGLRTIFQEMREQGEKVQGNAALSDEQKVSQIVKIRQGALGQTASILSAAQQKELSAVLLPKG